MKNFACFFTLLFSISTVAQDSDFDGSVYRNWNKENQEWVYDKIRINSKDKDGNKVETIKRWFKNEQEWGNVERETNILEENKETRIIEHWNVISNSWVNISKRVMFRVPPLDSRFWQYYDWIDGNWKVERGDFVIDTKKDKSGNLTELTIKGTTTKSYKFEYKRFGKSYRVVKIKTNRLNPYNNRTSQNEKFFYYEKGKNGYLVSKELSKSRSQETKTIFEYDDQDRLLSKSWMPKDLDEEWLKWEEENLNFEKYKYLKNGNIEETEQWKSGRKWIRTLDSKGELIGYSEYSLEDGELEEIGFNKKFYGDDGRLIREERFGACAGIHVIEIFYYAYENDQLKSKFGILKHIEDGRIENDFERKYFYSKKHFNLIENEDFKFSLFPNPNFGEFQLCSRLFSFEKSEIEIYDLKGQLVHKQKLKKGEECQPIKANALAGVYICKISADGFNQTIKMIIAGNKIHYP